MLIVCLKMLFRKTTRKRFIFLVAAFLFMMGFNTYSYMKRFQETEIQKQALLDEKAFKLFFIRTRTRNDCLRFLTLNTGTLRELGAEIVHEAFLYQNNLYVHLFPPPRNNPARRKESLDLLYDLFHIHEAFYHFFPDVPGRKYEIRVRSDYFDYNGSRLSKDMIRGREKSLKQDILDIADMIREDVTGIRIDAFNSVKRDVVDHMNRVPPDTGHDPNPYLSRVESVIPMNFLHILMNVRLDKTTDVFDLADSFRIIDDHTIEGPAEFLDIPMVYRGGLLYGDIYIYPRYIPLYAPDLITQRWNWLLYRDLGVQWDFMDFLNRLHFKGHTLFSYEKAHIIKEKVKSLNHDIRTNNIHFYLSDLSMGIAFPFMISLFAFIHLKTEIAYLLMFKNRIRELLFIFWLLPVSLMLLTKVGVLAFHFLSLSSKGLFFSVYMIFPLFITFLLASMAFYPINLWCFSQFTGQKLNLYTLHRGR